jgi:sec-independent protein translocase protein TatA
MFGLGTGEIIIILLVVLVLFGANKLSGIGKSMGQSVREFKEEVHKDDASEKSEPADQTTEKKEDQ